MLGLGGRLTKFTLLSNMFESFTPEFLDAEISMHRGKRSIQCAIAMSYVGPILVSPHLLTHMAAINITAEEILLRHPRFVVSGPVLIGIAIGAGTIATEGATAHFLAKEETSRVV